MTQYYTSKKWGDVYGNAIRTPVGRIVFVSLDRPNEFNQGKPKYGATLLFPKSDQKAWGVLYNNFYAHVQELVAQRFPGHTLENAPMVKSWITDGDEPAAQSGKIYASHVGHWVLKADADVAKKPGVIDNQGKPLDPTVLLPGMLCRFVVVPQVYQGFGGGVSYKLQQVMLVQDDGTRLYGGPDPTSIMLAGDDEVFNENAGYQPQQVAAQAPVQRQAPQAPVQVQVPAAAQYQPAQTVAPQQAVVSPQQAQAPAAPQAPRRGRPAAANKVQAQNTEATAVAFAPQSAPNPSPGTPPWQAVTPQQPAAPAPNGPQPAVRSPGGLPQALINGQPANGGVPGMRQGFATPPGASNGPSHQPMPPAVGANMPPKGPAGALKLV